MTCVVGLEHEGSVYMGSDSMASDGWSQSISRLPKVFYRTDYLIGYSSSFRMGQVLQYTPLPQWLMDGRECDSEEQFLVTKVVESIRIAFKEAGFTTIENSQESGGHFLIGFRSRLYHIANDFQVNSFAEGYAAIGSGEQYAIGALHATSNRMDPERRVLKALKAAEAHSTGVIGPFSVKCI